MIAESICHIGRCFLFAWRNPGFFYVYFQEVVTHGKPDQGDYGRDRRRYQEIGGDTSGLEKSLSAVNNSIKKTQSQLRDVNNLLKLDPSNTILLAQKQELLQSAIGDTEKKLEALESVQYYPFGAEAGTSAVGHRGYGKEAGSPETGPGGCGESL